MRRVVNIIVVLEVVTLAAFFISTRMADSLLPEGGGRGDATLMALWNSRAALAFGCLVGLWLLAVAETMVRTFRNRPRGAAILRAAANVGVSLPVIGLLLGYLALVVLN
jgi:hypothetical protein